MFKLIYCGSHDNMSTVGTKFHNVATLFGKQYFHLSNLHCHLLRYLNMSEHLETYTL